MIRYTYTEIKEIYYTKYLFNIKQIIKHGLFNYSFKNIDEIIIDKNRNQNLEENFQNPLNNDLYLKSYSEDKIKLGQDILLNGTYWPLVCCENKIIEGAHRVFSLQCLNKIIPFNKKFLCLDMPWKFENYIFNKADIILNDNLEKEMEYYKLTLNNEILKVKGKNSYKVHENNFKLSSYLLNNAIFTINKQYPNFIIPNPIFNDEKLFEQFLKDESF